MVDRMKLPEEADMVVNSVRPVLEKIGQKDRHNELGPNRETPNKRMQVFSRSPGEGYFGECIRPQKYELNEEVTYKKVHEVRAPTLPKDLLPLSKSEGLFDWNKNQHGE